MYKLLNGGCKYNYQKWIVAVNRDIAESHIIQQGSNRGTLEEKTPRSMVSGMQPMKVIYVYNIYIPQRFDRFLQRCSEGDAPMAKNGNSHPSPFCAHTPSSPELVGLLRASATPSLGRP